MRSRPGSAGSDKRNQTRGFGMEIGEFGAILAWEEAGAGGGGDRVWRGNEDARPDLFALGLPAAGERDLRGLGGAVGSKELLAAARIIQEKRGAVARAQERFQKRDKIGGGAKVAGDGLVEILGVDMPGGREGCCVDRGMNPKRQSAPAFEDRLRQMRHCIFVGDIQRCKRGRPAGFLDQIVQLLKPPVVRATAIT